MKPLAQNTLIQNRYLIVQLIGKGGMGEVYLAVDQRLGSAVAIKRTFYSGDDALGNAFEREAKILARLRHAVLPKVSDHFSEDEEQYLVMEHISGEDLSKRLESSGKSFPVTWVLFWADQLLDALSYLHSHEPPIIHRDIKPQNLKLTDENHIVLLDFGLSKNGVGQTKVPDASKSSSSVVGYTPHYAPMEQIRGIGTSPRSDLYGLAATLYQLITNQVPADALSRADALLNGMEDPIKPIHELNPEISVGVSDVIMKAMEVSQEKRFQTAREMQKKLRKAFAKMQEAMTAQTVAFNINETDAELPAPALPSNGIDDSKTITDFDQTMMQSPEPEIRQADLKTEVFSAGAMENGDHSAPMADDNYGPTVVENLSANESPDETPAYSPEATVPFIAVNNDVYSDTPVGETPAEPEAFFTEPAINDPTEHIPEEPAGFFTEPSVNVPTEADSPSAEDYDNEDNAAVAAGAQSAVVAQPPAKTKKKGGAGKFILMLLGLGFVFALILGAIGGVWYYMNEMQGGIPEPSPTPMIEVTPTPSPEETPFSGLNDNTNTETPTPTATPTETPTPVVETDPNPGGQTGPTRPNNPPPVRTPRPPRDTKPEPPRPPRNNGTKTGPTPLQ